MNIKGVKREVLSAVTFFIFMYIFFYFFHPGKTIYNYLIGSIISTSFYSIAMVLAYFKKIKRFPMKENLVLTKKYILFLNLARSISVKYN